MFLFKLTLVPYRMLKHYHYCTRAANVPNLAHNAIRLAPRCLVITRVEGEHFVFCGVLYNINSCLYSNNGYCLVIMLTFVSLTTVG